MDAFVNHSSVARVLAHGPTKSSIEVVQGPPKLICGCYRRNAMAQDFLISRGHFNIMCGYGNAAQDLGWSLNEHSFTRTDDSGEEIFCATEEEVYAVLGLTWISPELREDRGEIQAAEQNNLPNLIEITDMVSDLHMHTQWSDGKLTIRQMAKEAKALGLTHIVITDHSQSLGIANGLSVERLLAQQAEVRQVDAEMGDNFRVLHGTEMDIKADGTLDYPDEILAQLDVVIALGACPRRNNLGKQITERVLNAIRNPHVDIIGHPRSQLIPEREPSALDMDVVFEAALEHATAPRD